VESGSAARRTPRLGAHPSPSKCRFEEEYDTEADPNRRLALPCDAPPGALRRAPLLRATVACGVRERRRAGSGRVGNVAVTCRTATRRATATVTATDLHASAASVCRTSRVCRRGHGRRVSGWRARPEARSRRRRRRSGVPATQEVCKPRRPRSLGRVADAAPRRATRSRAGLFRGARRRETCCGGCFRAARPRGGVRHHRLRDGCAPHSVARRRPGVYAVGEAGRPGSTPTHVVRCPAGMVFEPRTRLPRRQQMQGLDTRGAAHALPCSTGGLEPARPSPSSRPDKGFSLRDAATTRPS
jgi:hypothetical protein